MRRRLGSHPKHGDTLGRWLLGGRLGSGGMATVFSAVDAQGNEAAIKVLNPATLPAEEVKRFTREYQALSKMNHVNVVRVFEAGVFDGYPWIAMELVRGTDLETHINKWAVKEPEDRYLLIERIIRGVCAGLQYVHDRGLIHRDIKPSNILITAKGEPKISDFGVVKGESTHGTQLTMAGRLVGTVAYMSPELITMEGVDHRCDLYSFGAVIYHMVTGRRPIEAASVAGYLARHLTEVPPSLGEVAPDCPIIFDQICSRLLQKDMAWRYANANAVIEALDRKDEVTLAPLRGQEALLEVVAGVVDRLRKGQGAVLGLVGAKGSGRSHLLHHLELTHFAEFRSVRIEGAKKGTIARLREGVGAGEGVGGVADLKAVARVVRGGPWVVMVDNLDVVSAGALSALCKLVRKRIAVDDEPLLFVFTTTKDAVETSLASLVSGDSTGAPCQMVSVAPLSKKAIVGMLRDRGLSGQLSAIIGRRLSAVFHRPGPINEQFQALVANDWFDLRDSRLYSKYRNDQYRTMDLPIPPKVRAMIEEQLGGLTQGQSQVVVALALLDRPASVALLTRCIDEDVHRSVLELQRMGVLRPGEEELWFAHASAAMVVRSRLPAQQRKNWHTRIAKALCVRRRSANAFEVAQHQRLGGNYSSAYSQYVAATRRFAKTGLWSKVLEVTSVVLEIEEAALGEMEPTEAARLERFRTFLYGQALLNRRQPQKAIPALKRALELGRQMGDKQAIGEALNALGKAYFFLNQIATAEPLLRDSLTFLTQASVARAGAFRALGDIHLRKKALTEAASDWEHSLDVADQLGSVVEQAKALRGLAHVAAAQGLLQKASQHLSRADDLLVSENASQVRCLVLQRIVEVDLAAGRYGAGLHRCTALLEISRREGLCGHLSSGLALNAAILFALGDEVASLKVAFEAKQQLLAQNEPHPEAAVRLARVFCDLDNPDSVTAVLPEQGVMIEESVQDLISQQAAIRARLLSPNGGHQARDLINWTFSRSAPCFPVASAQIALDLSKALYDMNRIRDSRRGAKFGLRQLQGPGADGLRLEILLQMYQCEVDERVAEVVKKLYRRLVTHIPKAYRRSFASRRTLRNIIA